MEEDNLFDEFLFDEDDIFPSESDVSIGGLFDDNMTQTPEEDINIAESAMILKPKDIPDGYVIEDKTYEIPNQSPVIMQYAIPPTPTLQHELEMWNVIDEFDQKSWSKSNVGLKTGWASVDKALDGGLQPGFIVIGGDSNLGKSGFISQMARQVATLNPNAYVMDFSLDDPMKDKLPRVISCLEKLPLNAVKNPNNYTNSPGMLIRREQGIIKLREMVKTYRSYDANFSTFLEDIEEEVQRIMVMLEATGQERKIVVFIDNMHDLNIKEHPSFTDKQKFDYIAQWCADVAIRYDIVLVASAELKKLNGTRRPALDDIREAVKIKYEAKAILLVYNEVHYKGEGSSVYFLRQGDQLRQPVFEVHFAKNKFHTYKGRLFFNFFPEMARFEECDDQTAKQYANLVFSS